MILHLDMDAFFASVEQMDNPDLRGKPVIIGGETRGVVATASYEARAFGVHSAMPVVTARKLCPGGVFLRGNYRRYSEISAKVMASLKKWSPVVQPASIDEAYIDAGEPADPVAFGRAVKETVANAAGGLTCSVGIAPVKFLAKICSDINKPDGVFALLPDEVDAFLLPLPVRKLPGIGPAMAASLQKFGIIDIAGLRRLSRDFLWQRYGKHGLILYERCRGIDPRPVRENPPSKSESAERTFERDIRDRDLLNRALLAHAEKVAARLQKNGFAGRTITVKIKFADFRQITRSRTIGIQTSDAAAIYETGRAILAAEHLPAPVRLIGLGVSGFERRPTQLLLPGMEPKLAEIRRRR